MLSSKKKWLVSGKLGMCWRWHKTTLAVLRTLQDVTVCEVSAGWKHPGFALKRFGLVSPPRILCVIPAAGSHCHACLNVFCVVE